MKLFSRILAGVMALAMILCLTSCGDNSWVYEYDGVRMNSGTYLAYLLDGYYEVAGYEEIAANKSEDKDILSLTVEDGTSVKDEIVKVTKQTVAETLFAMSELKKAGIEISEEDLSQMKNYAQSMYSYYSGLYEKNGVGVESYKTYYSNYYYYDQYFLYLYGDKYENGGEKAPSDQEYMDYYKNNYVNYYMLTANFSKDTTESDTVSASDAEKNTENNKKIEERFEDYAKRLNNGEEFEAIREEEAEKAGTELKKDDNDKVIPAEASVADLTTIESNTKDLAAALKEMKSGEARYVKTSSVAYLVVKNDLKADANDDKYKDSKSDILYKLKSDEYSKWIEEQAGAITLTANDYAVKYYAPKKLIVA